MMSEKLRCFFASPNSNDEKRILYLTGLAGSGKTSIAQNLEERLGATLIKEFLDPIPDSVMDTRVDSGHSQKVEAQRWVLGQYSQKNDLIAQMTGNIIVDRTWVDALVYSQIYGEAVLETISAEVESQEWHLGMYVILFADELVIKRRLQGKFDLTESDWQNSWGPYIKELRLSVIKLADKSNLLSIDTSNLSVEEACGIIESNFNQHFSK